VKLASCRWMHFIYDGDLWFCLLPVEGSRRERRFLAVEVEATPDDQHLSFEYIFVKISIGILHTVVKG